MSSEFSARVVEEAEGLWRENPSAKTIAERNDWGWHYGRPGFQWCGHTAACVFRALGVNPELCRATLSSTARLADRGPAGTRWKDHGYTRPAVHTDDMRPGDLVCIVTSERKSYGDHVVICVDGPEDGEFTTMEGNAKGSLCAGGWAKGVVTRKRKLTDVRQVLRITEEHCNE
jgi:hypothetical protein